MITNLKKVYVVTFYDNLDQISTRFYIAKNDTLLKSDILSYINIELIKYGSANIEMYNFYKKLNNALIEAEWVDGSLENYIFELTKEKHPLVKPQHFLVMYIISSDLLELNTEN